MARSTLHVCAPLVLFLAICSSSSVEAYPVPPRLPPWATGLQKVLSKEDQPAAAVKKAKIFLPHASASHASSSGPTSASSSSLSSNVSSAAAAFVQISEAPALGVPVLVPSRRFKDSLKRVFQNTNKDAVVHEEKLEKMNKKLRSRVNLLEQQLGDERVAELSDELGAVAASGREYESEQVRNVGVVSTWLMFGSIVIAASVTYLTKHECCTVKAKTWWTLEKVMIVFVAVMWFQAFDETFSWFGASLRLETLFSVLHALTIFAVLVGVAVKLALKNDPDRLISVLIAWGMHYLSFALVHAGGHVQAAFFSWHPLLCFLGVFVLLGFFAGISALTRKVLLKKFENTDESHFVDQMEELEDDAIGMMLAFVFTLFIRYLICGSYQAMQEGDNGLTIQHTMLQRSLLFLYALAMIGIAVFAIPRLNALGERLQDSLGAYATQRLLLLLNPFLVMSVAWAFLLWADWEFYEYRFRGELVLGRAVVGVLCTLACFASILVYGRYAKRFPHPDRNHGDRLRRQSSKALDLAWRWADLEKRKFVLNAMAVIMGFSWGEAFNASIDGALAGYMHPLLLKVLLALLVTALAYPVYTHYVRDMVSAMERQEDDELGISADAYATGEGQAGATPAAS